MEKALVSWSTQTTQDEDDEGQVTSWKGPCVCFRISSTSRAISANLRPR
jgi:hypothetical protein